MLPARPLKSGLDPITIAGLSPDVGDCFCTMYFVFPKT